MVGVQHYVPAQGDFIWLMFTPQARHEQGGRRPALVLSPTAYNRRVGLLLCCPITNHVKGYPFEVVLPEGLIVTGAILADQIKSLDWRVRQAARIAAAPPEIIDEVMQKLHTLLPFVP